MFRGELALNLDSKGRLAVPSRYRDRLSESCGGRLVATISLLEPCLVVYPFPDWQAIEDKLKGLPALDTKAQAIRHLLIGHASESDMDSHGRVLLSPSLREFAGLNKRIRLVGQDANFELWDEETWVSRREELLSQVEAIRADPGDALRALVF